MENKDEYDKKVIQQDVAMFNVLITKYQEKAKNSSGDYQRTYNEVVYYLSRAISRFKELE